ncbi:Cyclin-a2-1 [Thalictrum thalictroides]|uniref:Cyclin-a2-1 n=1 Tax=Thalictrum thalictroides TaxID=46969 RepID=A0A7J6X4X8_THATH|nr:Cyclin-a2-1 [Thalictrum thalictroides]
MNKENISFEPTGRITRARAAAYRASGGMLPPKPCTRQTQKECPEANSKRSGSDENCSVSVTGQNKRRAVLKDVTNVLCESSYKSCMNAAKIQTRGRKQSSKSFVKNGSKVCPVVAVEVKKIKDDAERKIAEETAKMEIVTACAEIQQNKNDVVKKVIDESEKIESVEVPKVMFSVKREESLLLANIGNNIKEGRVADRQPGGQNSKKPTEHLIIVNKDETKSCENSEGGTSIINIDSDLKDPLMCSLYAPDIYKNIRVAELIRRPSSSFMESLQRDITKSMRGILIDWLVEVSEEYRLTSDTLYLTVYLIDRFLSQNFIERQRLQLLGITCMLIASKYEEICAPRVEEFCFITDNTYTKTEVVDMESKVLNYLEFQLSTPTVKTFLRRYLRAAHASYTEPSLELEFLASFLTELTLVEYEFLKALPSLIAASAIFLARWTLDQSSHPWNATLEHYTSYKASDLKCTVSALQDLQKNTSGSPLNAIRDKYRQEKFERVANLSSPIISPMLFES